MDVSQVGSGPISLEFASFGADGWSVEIVDADVDTDRYSAFAYDANGNPQISYLVARNRESGTIRYASWDGEQFTDLINWTVDANIAAGPEGNQRLGVWAEGDRLVLYVNGFKVGEVQDSTYMPGDVAAYRQRRAIILFAHQHWSNVPPFRRCTDYDNTRNDGIDAFNWLRLD